MQPTDALHVAVAALPRFGVRPDAAITFVKYRENHVYRIDDGADAYALRLHRPGYRDDEAIATEVRYLQFLRDRGVSVPEVVPALDGSPVVRVEARGHSRLASLQRWIADAAPFGAVDGALDGTHSPHPDEFARIGRALGRMHAVGEGIPADFRRDAWDADGLAGPRPLWGDPRALPTLTAQERDTVARAQALVHRHLSALPRDAAGYGVIHADATPENLLVVDDDIMLIDFDDFGTGWFAFDLVTALFHHTGNAAYPVYERALRDAYAHAHVDDGTDERTWDILMCARGLTYLGWAAERPGDDAAAFVSAHVAPVVLEIATALLESTPTPWRRRATESLEDHA